MSDKIYMVPNPPTPGKAVVFNPDICIGCNQCAEVCPTDVFMPNPDKKKPPIVLYPDECWGCGVCQDECPHPGAITMVHPMNQGVAVTWKRKSTGKYYRLGMKNPPPPNIRPPSG